MSWRRRLLREPCMSQPACRHRWLGPEIVFVVTLRWDEESEPLAVRQSRKTPLGHGYPRKAEGSSPGGR